MKKVFYLLLTGVAIGMLIAPGKGSDTWQKITEYLDDLGSKVKNTVNDLVDGVKGMADEGKKSTEKAANEW